MVEEPVPRELGGAHQRARLLEQVGRTGHDGQPRLAAQHRLRLAVQPEHQPVPASDDEQGRRADGAEALGGEIRAATAGHDGGDRAVRLGRRPQRGRRAGARAEVAEPHQRQAGLPVQPPGGGREPLGQQPDVEDVRAVALLLGGEQVEEEGAEAGRAEDVRDEPVAGAEPAAAAAVGEDDDRVGPRGHPEVAEQDGPVHADPDVLLAGGDAGCGFRSRVPGHRGLRRVRDAGPGEQPRHLVIGHLREVAVELPDGVER
ncbi:MAG TPA: hypothetical protein VFN73_10625 [Propionibacteriaceae bacterium]|nr:hypothetical protein [Propionibacteriaceae bacterium]